MTYPPEHANPAPGVDSPPPPPAYGAPPVGSVPLGPPFPPYASGVPARRPGSVIGAVVILGVFAAFTLLVAGMRLVAWLLDHPSDGWYFALAIKDSTVSLLICAGLVVAALLTARGLDAGRALGFGFAGYAVLAGLSGAASTVIFSFSESWAVGNLLMALGALITVALGAAVFGLLLSRSAADWFAEQRAAQR